VGSVRRKFLWEAFVGRGQGGVGGRVANGSQPRRCGPSGLVLGPNGLKKTGEALEEPIEGLIGHNEGQKVLNEGLIGHNKRLKRPNEGHY
jgi:hypothetical protein